MFLAAAGRRPRASFARPRAFSHCPRAIAASSRRRSRAVNAPWVRRAQPSPPRRSGSGGPPGREGRDGSASILTSPDYVETVRLRGRTRPRMSLHVAQSSCPRSCSVTPPTRGLRMAYMITHFWPGASVEQYNATVAVVHPPGALPEGQTYHVAGETDGGILITAVWESKQRRYSECIAHRYSVLPVSPQPVRDRLHGV